MDHTGKWGRLAVSDALKENRSYRGLLVSRGPRIARMMLAAAVSCSAVSGVHAQPAPPLPLPSLPPACPGDWNRSCTKSPQDIFDFLQDFFDGARLADTNRDGLESVQDLFDFLQSYFGACTPCAADIRMVVFGDSLSDVGRHFLSYDDPAEPSFQGRFSDGPVWVEYLSQSMGIAPQNVRNYAIGGATSGHDNCCTPGATGVLAEMEEYIADRSQSDAFNPEALYVLWVGANDFETWQRTGALQTQPPNVLINAAIGNIATAVRTLAANGARRILIGNLPDLGRIPKVTTQNDPVAAGLATTGTIMFNANLAWELSRLEETLDTDIILLDVHALFEAIQTDPAAVGFTDAAAACYPPNAASPCANPSTHVFWDDVHPTTAAHRLLAAAGQVALTTGGTPLESTLCPPHTARVQFTMPDVQFTTMPTVSISGQVTAAPASTHLVVNGITMAVASDGTFRGVLVVDTHAIVRPIVAELHQGATLLDRDRVVVIRGDTIAQGDEVRDAVVADLRSTAIPAIRNEVAFQLLAQNQLQIGRLLPVPLRADYDGNVQWEARTTSVGFGCHNVDAELHSGFVRLRLSLHDILLTFHVHSWWSGPDPGVDCDGWVAIPEFSVYADVALQPSTTSPDALRAVVVTDLALDRPPTVNWSIGDCDLGPIPFGVIDGAIADAAGDLSQAVQMELQNQVGAVTIADLLEDLMREISINGPIGGALGADVMADFNTIQHGTDRVALKIDARINGSAPSTARTLAVPHDLPPRTGSVPISGEAYGLSAAISLESLNQLLLARADLFLTPIELASIDLGSGSFPINAGLLAALIPSMHDISPSAPYVLRVRPSQSPMLTGEQSPGGDFEIIVPHVLIDIVPAGAGQNNAAVAFSIDLRAYVTFGFNRLHGELTVGLVIPEDGVSPPVILENRVCANETTLHRLIGSLRGLLAQKIAEAGQSFPLPAIEGLGFELLRVVPEGGYACLYFDTTTSHARPDIAVAQIDMPNAIDMNFPFDVRFRVENPSTVPIYSGLWMGASLSADPVFVNGDDIGIGQQFFPFAQDPLRPGESRWLTLHNLRAPVNIPPNQTLFILADVPPAVGGGGVLCESSERNNVASVSLVVTNPDAYIASIDLPPNVIGGVGPRPYRVRVGRSNLGTDYLDVPIRVTIGSPVLTWGDVWARVPRGQEVTIDVFVATPGSVGGCGQINNFTVVACANLQVDANRTNDCGTATVPIAVPYFDLAYEIVNDPEDPAPTDGYRGSSARYKVRVTNVGNINSPGSVDSRTAICLSRHGFETWWNDCIFGCGPAVPLLFSVNSLQPGLSRTYTFNYPVCWGASAGYQYINAAPDYSRGAFDNCGGSNNNSSRRIRIH